ncbi:MAG: N-acetyltransferase [Halobacteriales archaeon]|nr:N-acetyltransferase [Halobacteriales archaeon]
MTRRVSVRRARPHDAKPIAEMERACFKNPNPQLVLHVCGFVDGFLVAEGDAGILGYVLFTPSSSSHARVLSLAVSPDHRRRGVATCLMRGAFDVLRRRDFESVGLEVRVSNEAAQSLYEELGFVYEDTDESYYDDGEDAYIMKKKL